MNQNQLLREALAALIDAHEAQMAELGVRMKEAGLTTLNVPSPALLQHFEAVKKARAALAQPADSTQAAAYIENGVLVHCTLPVGFTGPLYAAPPASKPTHITWDASGRRLINGAPDLQPADGGEPFGYFRALPFGWEQCAETDEGAIALYDRPQKDRPADVGTTAPVWLAQELDGHTRVVLESAHLAALANHPASQPADGGEVVKRKLIGWRTENYLWETDDPDKARNWEPNIGVLPIFEGDPNTKLAAPPASHEQANEILRLKADIKRLEAIKRVSIPTPAMEQEFQWHWRQGYEAGKKASQEQAETCGACDGSGRMVRDPDIGTDQECFACDGSGKDSQEQAQQPQAHWTEHEPVRLAASRVGRVYLAGPMTGIAEFNFPAFNAEAARLRATGLYVLNPADHGVVDGADWADYLRHDIAGLASCERIHLLRGWSKSKGATLEVTIAKALGMSITFQDGAEQPQAQAQELPDEREAFEAWAKKQSAKIDKDIDGDYLNLGTQCAWLSWQARAALAAKQERKPMTTDREARQSAQAQNDELKAECIKLTSKLSNAMGTRKVLWNLLGESLPLLCQIDCNDGESEERLNHLIQRIEDARSVVQAEELPCRTESLT